MGDRAQLVHLERSQALKNFAPAVYIFRTVLYDSSISKTHPHTGGTMNVGDKIAFNYKGMTVEGRVVSLAWDHVKVGRGIESDQNVRFLKERISDIRVLERAVPADTYPAGTVMRFRRAGSASQYSTAVKQPSGDWHRDGAFATWETLMNCRPLTVLAQSTVIE